MARAWFQILPRGLGDGLSQGATPVEISTGQVAGGPAERPSLVHIPSRGGGDRLC